MNRSTPFSPSRANARRSVIRPSIGSWSILKSPVCSTVPAPVVTATASASGIEWFTAMNSHSNAPNFSRVALAHDARDRLDAVLLELGLDERQRQARADQRDVAAQAQQVRDGTDVVLVPVGQDDRLDVVQAVLDVLEVGQDQVDAGLVVLGEQDAAVDDEQAAGVLEDGHVAADLTEPTQRDDAQGAAGQGRRQGELGVRVTHVSPGGISAPRRRAARRHEGRHGSARARRRTRGRAGGAPSARAARPSTWSAAFAATAWKPAPLSASIAGMIDRKMRSASAWSPASNARTVSAS